MYVFECVDCFAKVEKQTKKCGRDGKHRCKKCRQRISDRKRYWLHERDARIKRATIWNKTNPIARKRITSKNYRKTYSTESGKEKILNRFRTRYWKDPVYYRMKATAKQHGVSTNYLKELETEQNKCQLCGKKKKLTIDHKHPVSKGGKATPENLHKVCGPCNSWKSNKLFLADGSGYLVGESYVG